MRIHLLEFYGLLEERHRNGIVDTHLAEEDSFICQVNMRLLSFQFQARVYFLP